MKQYYALDNNDPIIKCLARGISPGVVQYTSTNQIKTLDANIPLILRGMAKRKAVAICEKQRRDFFYIDTGYIGNLGKKKNWHRIVKNGMQHSQPRYDLPDDRFNKIIGNNKQLKFPNRWKKSGTTILLVTPSSKPCLFYGINRQQWIDQTIGELQKHTDRPIIVREKGRRSQRTGSNSIYNQIVDDKVFAVVTYNSIAATEAIGYGIPAFTLAPNIADTFCLKDLSKIETPLYADCEQVVKWQHWIGYGQFTREEMQDSSALKILNKYSIL